MSTISALNKGLFEAYVSAVMQESPAVGIAVAVVDRGGNTLYENCFGFRDSEAALPIDANTICGMASVTKSFTALAIMQLCEKGIIDINAPAANYLPGFTDPSITVAQLMTHSAGFGAEKRTGIDTVCQTLGLDPEKDGDLAYNAMFLDYAGKAVCEKMCAQTDRVGRPGENCSYSNDSYALLSEIVRHHGGERSFTEYVKKYILDPLGMARTGCQFLWDDGNITRFYQKQDGQLKGDFTTYYNLSALPGAGNMKSTLSDMKKYITMYLNNGVGQNGKRVIGSFQVREMQKPRLACGVQEYYGYGLRTEFLDDLTIVCHGGSLTGVSTNMCWSHDAGLGVMVICNTSGVAVASIARAAMLLGCGKIPLPPRNRAEPVAWDEETAQLVCGDYKTNEGARLSIFRKDSSLMLRQGELESELEPISQCTLRTRRPFADMLVRVFFDDSKTHVWAVGSGLRIIKRAPPEE